MTVGAHGKLFLFFISLTQLVAQDRVLCLTYGLKEQESCFFTLNAKDTDLQDEDHEAGAYDVNPRP